MLWCTKTICLDRLPRICCCWNIEYIIYYNKSYFFVGKVNIYNVNIYVSSFMNCFSKIFGIVAACYSFSSFRNGLELFISHFWLDFASIFSQNLSFEYLEGLEYTKICLQLLNNLLCVALTKSHKGKTEISANLKCKQSPNGRLWDSRFR